MPTKRSHLGRERNEIARQRGLLLALSNDLALPLLQVRASTELLESKNFSKAAARQYAGDTHINVDSGLQLVEAYRLLLNAEEIDKLPPEPLSVGSLLDDIAHKLSPYAKNYGTAVEVNIQHRLSPVLAHQPSLSAAIEVLGASLIKAQAAQSDDNQYRLVLGAHKAADNAVAAGVFSGAAGVSDKTLRAARGLIGRARQPLPSVPQGAAAGILVADMLCAAFWQPLRIAAHNNLAGLVTTVPMSKQLKFV